MRWPPWGFIFQHEFLLDLLREDAADKNSSHDFGKDIIPHIVKNGKAVAHRFAQSCVRSSKKLPPIGAMWERWMPIGSEP